MIDTAYRVSTPEGIELTLELAGPVPRALAWLIDLAWRLGAMLALVFGLAWMGRFGGGILLIAWFALEWLVPAAFEVLNDGATPGKRALGIAVLRDDGAPLDWGAALTRNLLRFADFLPFGYLGGLLCMLGSSRFKRLGDLAAGTVVVYVSRAQRTLAIEAAEPVATNLPLALEDKRAILDFAERAPQLTPERAEELAAIAAPALGAPTTQSGAAWLVGVANHLLGPRSPTGVPHAPG